MKNACIFTLAALASSASGQIEYELQERQISAAAWGSGVNEVTNAELGLFTDSVYIEYGLGGDDVAGFASITSDLSADRMTANAFSWARGFNAFPSSGITRFNVTFSLNEPLPFKFLGVAKYDASSTNAVRLVGPNGTIIERPLIECYMGDCWTASDTADIAGTLQPGEYQIVGTAIAQRYPNYGEAMFDLDFSVSTPTCTGDVADDFGTLGGDGTVSFGDFLALLGLVGECEFFDASATCTGDIADDTGTLGTVDGMVSFGDFLALLGLVGPCP